MRLIKMLGLAAVAAMAAMAFIGASSASASLLALVLCEVPTLTCEEADQFESPTTIIGHATNPKLLSSIGTVECEKSLAELTLLNELASITEKEEKEGKKPLQLSHLLALSFEGNCHLGGTSCTVTVNELGLISLTKIGELEASAKSTGGTKATVKCGSFINCSYAGEPLLKVKSETVKDTEPEKLLGVTKMIAEKTVLKGGGFLCPSTSEWDATYTGEVDLKVVKEGKEELVSDPNIWIES